MDKDLIFLDTKKERLDSFLSFELSESRSAVSKLIKESCVYINEKPILKPSHILKEMDKISISFPKTKLVPSSYEIDFDIEILYEDEDLLVINKPKNLVVHSAPSHKGVTLVDWLKFKNIRLSTIYGEERHGIVHRIDKDTTGALIIAKNNSTHQELSQQLQEKTLGRYYLAIIDVPLKEDLIVRTKISRHPTKRTKMAVTKDGRDAKSFFFKIATSKDEKIELIGAKLFTGRTHQIRVHLNHLGRTILGDNIYGTKAVPNKIESIFLHAYLLYFFHPKKEKIIYVMAPLSDSFKDFIENNFNKEDLNEKLTQNWFINSFNNFNNRM